MQVYKIKKSVWKFPFSYKLNNFMDLKEKKKVLKRNITITSSLLGKSFYVHKGNKVGKLVAKENMIGHKTGEFFITKVIGARIAYRKKLKLQKKKSKGKGKK